MADEDYTPEEWQEQEKIHDALSEHLDIPEGHILVSWVVVYDTATVDSERSLCGSMLGPRGTTTWKARGMLSWAQEFLLVPDNEEDEQDG